MSYTRTAAAEKVDYDFGIRADKSRVIRLVFKEKNEPMFRAILIDLNLKEKIVRAQRFASGSIVLTFVDRDEMLKFSNKIYQEKYKK